MIGKPGRQFLLSCASIALTQLFWVSARGAPVFIPTNFGGGAEAEVREDADTDMRPNTDPAWGPPGAPRGRNRGGLVGETAAIAGGMELASRVKDTTANATNDRSSAMYLKFNISGISQSDLNNN